MKKKFLLALALSVLALFSLLLVSCDGEDGTNAGPTTLSAPTGLRYDGVTISWDTVANAEKYTVKIGEGEEISTAGAGYAYMNTAGTPFTVSVTAVAEGLDPSPTTIHTFCPLATVTELTVADDGTVSWNSVDGATGYLVNVDGTDVPVTANSYGDLTAGAHVVKVKPTATSAAENLTYYASWSSVIDLTICADVESDSITYSAANASLSWKAVPNAVGYHLVISGGLTSVDTVVNATNYAFNAGNGDFTVSLRAVGNHTSSYDSKNAAEKTFVYLDAPTGLRVADGTLYWNAVSGADGYQLKVNGTVANTIATECQFSGFPVNRTITVNLLPVSNDTAYFSAWSTDFSFSILAAPVLQWNDYALDGVANSNVYWDSVVGATGYQVQLSFGGQVIDTATLGADERAYAHAYLQAGEYTIEVKALADSNTSNLYSSAYSQPIKVTRLVAPSFAPANHITSDPGNVQSGMTVTYQNVGGATAYRIWKDGTVYTTTSSTQYRDAAVIGSNVTAQQTINYKIQSVGRSMQTVNGVKTVYLDSLSSEALSFDITVLAAPTNCTITGFSYSYTEVSGAFGYTVDLNGAGTVNGSLVFDLSVLPTGVTQVKVSARGNGTNILPSNYTPAIEVQRLAAPLNVEIDVGESDGVLKYTPVTNATGYEAVIDGLSNPLPVAAMTNVKQYIRETGTALFLRATANYFNQDGTVYYMTSRDGDTVTFIKLARPTFGTSPFNGSQLVWNAPSNVNVQIYAPSYKVTNAQNVSYTAGVFSSPVMSTSMLKGGTSYTFLVQAIGDGKQYINSDLSESVSAYKLETPGVSRTLSGYQWNGVLNASSYTAYVDGVRTYQADHISGQSYSFAPGFNEIKTYVVQIYAVGDNNSFIDSEPAEIHQETKQLTTPSFTFAYDKSVVSVDGQVVVTITGESPYATGYSYSVGGHTETSVNSTFTYGVNVTSGAIVIRVYALGGGFDEDGVYYIDSQSAGGNASSTLYLLGTAGSFSITNEGYIDWSDVDNATAYDITLTVNGSEVYTVSDLRSSSYDINQTVDFSTVQSLTIAVTAKGNANCVPSQPATKEWTNLH